MKILIVSEFCHLGNNGGGERRYYELAKRLVSIGHKVDWLCMRTRNNKSSLSVEGINIFSIGSLVKNPPKRSIWNFFTYHLNLAFFLFRRRYDLIDCNPYVPLFTTFFVSSLKNQRMLATIHDVSDTGKDQRFQSGFFGEYIERFLVKLPYKRIITVSDSIKKKLSSQPYSKDPSKVSVVHNGADLNFIDSIPSQDKKYDLISVGRIIPHKHMEDFVELVKKLKKRGEIRAAIVGNGPDREKIRALIKKEVLESNIDLVSDLQYSEVIRMIKESKILILSSTREGFGMVLAEANACLVPVIAYDVAGVVDVVNNGENGYLVEPRNLEELESKANELLSNTSKRKAMGLKGRKKVEEMFTWDKAAKEIEKIYSR